MSDVVQQAKAALEGVTEGPWDVVSGAWGNVWHFPDEGTPTVVVRLGGMSEPDAEFIAAARSLVPDLVAEVEKLRGAIETIRFLAKRHANAFHVGGDYWRQRAWLDILAVIERTEQP